MNMASDTRARQLDDLVHGQLPWKEQDSRRHIQNSISLNTIFSRISLNCGYTSDDSQRIVVLTVRNRSTAPRPMQIALVHGLRHLRALLSGQKVQLG